MKRLKARVIAAAGSRYIAGERIEDVDQACARLRKRGYEVTICYWDGSPDLPQQIMARYEESLSVILRHGGYLSVKATALDFSLPMFTRIADRGARLHFDAMAMDTVDRTFDLIGKLKGERGCTIPARWRRSDADADRAVEMGLAIRIVKGQFKGDDREPEAGFLSIVDRVAGRAKHVAVASHDQKLATEALRRLRAKGTPCELEQLHGIPLQPAPARVYVPYGHALLPYAMAQLRNNPKILWWLTRDLVMRRPIAA